MTTDEAKFLYWLYIQLTEPDRDEELICNEIESNLKKSGFVIEIGCDPFGRMYLYDKKGDFEVAGTSI